MTEPVSVCIRALGNGGAGIGKREEGALAPFQDRDDRVWFVPGTLVGELVLARPDRSKKKYVHAQLVEVVRPSPKRVEPVCAWAEQCGGCGWMHIDPACQAQFKADIVLGQLRHLIEGIDQVFQSPQSLQYRRRTRLHYERRNGELEIGFYRAGQHQLVDIPFCGVFEPSLNHALSKIRQLADLLPEQGEVYGLCHEGQAICGLPGIRITQRLEQQAAQIIDDVLLGLSFRSGRKHMVVGRGHLSIDEDKVRGWPAIEADPFTFAQAQSTLNTDLVRYVCSQIESRGCELLELFCGSGNFTRGLATVAKRVWAWDSDRSAIQTLDELRRTNYPNINPRHGGIERALTKYIQEKRRFEQAVLDPPRSGLGQTTSDKLADIVDSQIVYISCDAATLARDARALCAKGFAIKRVAVFDMMPMTSEVEVVVNFARSHRGLS